MTEETAVRIAEALESIDGGIKAGLFLIVCFGFAYMFLIAFKH